MNISQWHQLETELADYIADQSKPGVEYRNPYQAIIGFPIQGFRSDGMLCDGKNLLAIEVEAGQMHPDTNVGKYWLLWDQYKPYERIVLIHIFTAAFNSYRWRKQLAEFYISKLKAEVPLEYVQLDFRENSNYSDVVSRSKVVINRKVLELFT